MNKISDETPTNRVRRGRSKKEAKSADDVVKIGRRKPKKIVSTSSNISSNTTDKTLPIIEELSFDDSFQDESLSADDSSITTLSKRSKEVKDKFVEPLSLDPNEDKSEILYYLRSRFGECEVVNNYMIIKRQDRFDVDYQYITDIACPNLKIDFEFNNAFWHNMDFSSYNISVRKQRLQEDGWKIVDIDKKMPRVADIIEYFNRTS